MKRAVLLLLLMHATVTAQVGTWHTYTDMQIVHNLLVDTDGIWAATSGGVFFGSNSGFVRYTNVDGLSATDYSAIARGEDGTILAGASNGMINVRDTDGSWYEVSDIARATEYPDRGINTIVTREGLAYIATAFGVVVYNISRREFADTWQKFGELRTRISVIDLHIDGTKLWVATSEGVAVGDLRSINLQDPARWTSFTGTSTEEFGTVEALSAVGGQPVLFTVDKMFRFDGAAWYEFVGGIPGGTVQSFVPEGENALFCTEYTAFRVTPEGRISQIGDALSTSAYPVGSVMHDVAAGEDGSIHIATNLGIATWRDGQPWEFRKPNGPNSNYIQALTVDPSTGLLWVSSGTSGGGHGVSRFDGSSWDNLSVDVMPGMETNAIMDVRPDGQGGQWFATWGEGVCHVHADGRIEFFRPDNIPGFPAVPESKTFAAVRNVRMDAQGNLWALHYNAPTDLLGCYTPAGNWFFLSDPGLPGELELRTFEIDQYGQKWAIINDPSFRGVLLLNDNGTPSQTSDDTWTRLSASDADVLNADQDVTAVAVDLLGDVWVGTDRGLRTVFNPLEPQRVSKTCFNTRCNIEGQYITAIAVDPVNNKWIGTKEGVFVLSADGSEIIAQYDVNNSPLLANEIQALTVHPETGVAYIATSKGLSSLVTPYVQPVASFEELGVAPNPFRPGLDDRVMIDGLVEEAIVKILSVSGDLVAEFTSPGGRVAFWDGRTLNGGIAPSGVYIVVAAAPNGSQTATTKLAVVRP